MEKSVLVINLTRLGDLLQTQPLLDGLAAGNASCGLLCLENFIGALPMLRNLEDAWPLGGAGLLAAKSRSWPEAVSKLEAFVRGVRSEGRYSWIINLTPTTPARILARMLARDGAQVLGFDIDENGFGVNHGVWSAFLNVSSLHRGCSPFNVADIFRMIGLPLLPAGMPGENLGALASPGAAARAWARDFLEQHPASEGTSAFVALQLGASAAIRQWPVENFARLARKLREEGFCSVLVGSANERLLAEAFAAAAGCPFVDATGKTDIPQLGALLENCRLLATNDTGTMHLASGLGVRCLAFFLATAQPWDTGPYAPGNCCLEAALECHPCAFNTVCENGEGCRRHIEPAFAEALALAWLREGDWRAGLSPELCARTRVWLTTRDSFGFASLSCISGHEDRSGSAWLRTERDFWRQLLDELSGHPSELIQPTFAPPANFARDAAPVLAQAAKDMKNLRNVAVLVGKNARAGELFLKGCDNIQNMLDCCPPLVGLGDFWRELRANCTDFQKFAVQLSICAKHLENFASYLRAFL